VPRSIFIGLDGSFAPWVGALIQDVQHPILLVAPEDKIEEAVTRLSRVGFDNTIGYLEGGLEAWKAAGMEVDKVTSMEVEKVANILADAPETPVFDVRKQSEFAAGHVADAQNTPLDYLNDYLASFPKEETFYVHCKSGYRSMIAASMLKARGYHNIVDIKGGYQAITQSGIKVIDPVQA